MFGKSRGGVSGGMGTRLPKQTKAFGGGLGATLTKQKQVRASGAGPRAAPTGPKGPPPKAGFKPKRPGAGGMLGVARKPPSAGPKGAPPMKNQMLKQSQTLARKPAPTGSKKPRKALGSMGGRMLKGLF